jgi:hypothetical protein
MPTESEIARAAKLQPIAAVAERAAADRRIPGTLTNPNAGRRRALPIN